MVMEVPARCPYCSSMNRDIYSTMPFPTLTMRLEDGSYHVGFRRQYAKCCDCQKRFTIKIPMFLKRTMTQ